jgi:hypothetical protein
MSKHASALLKCEEGVVRCLTGIGLGAMVEPDFVKKVVTARPAD